MRYRIHSFWHSKDNLLNYVPKNIYFSCSKLCGSASMYIYMSISSHFHTALSVCKAVECETSPEKSFRRWHRAWDSINRAISERSELFRMNRLSDRRIPFLWTVCKLSPNATHHLPWRLILHFHHACPYTFQLSRSVLRSSYFLYFLLFRLASSIELCSTCLENMIWSSARRSGMSNQHAFSQVPGLISKRLIL